MNWAQQLFIVLNNINNVILYFIGIPFILQMIYMLLFFLPKKTFPKSDKKSKICVVIPAHNEADVIYNTVKDLIDKQTYPREMFDVYVVAHNCTDNTKEEAEKAGAVVFELNDEDPSKHIVAYALKHAYEEIIKTGIHYDFSIRFDADNHCNDEFLSLMNDAYNSGVRIARPYESGINMTQNYFTQACGLYYTFDSRFSSRARERLGIDAHVNGPGSLIAFDIIERIGGYDTTSITEDTEFNFKRMLEGEKCHFVEDAIVYEDLPSNFTDTFNRNKRIASGNIRLLGKYTPLFLWKSISKLRFSFLEQILTYMFNIICILLCTWLPAFYIYSAIYLGVNGCWTQEATALFFNLPIGQIMGLKSVLTIVAFAICCLFLLCGLGQGFLLVLLDYKKMGAKTRRELIPGVLLFPAFTVIYCLTMCIGAFTKPKWNKINRNVNQSKE